jgi:gluconolactonase
MPSHKIIADGLQFPEGPVIDRDGSVLVVEIERRTVTRIAADGSKSIVAQLEGGPNGMAWGPDGALYICNNGGFLFRKIDGVNRTTSGVPEGYAGGWIERVDPRTGEHRVLYARCGDHNLVGPNDIVFDAHGGFYFTDYGKFYPRYRMNGGLYYALADGSRIVEIAYPMITPNGVGLSPDGKTLYVSETDTGRLWSYPILGPGELAKQPWPSPNGGKFLGNLAGYHRFDSMAVEANGNICVATLVSGGITVFSPQGEALEYHAAPEGYCTNICFGGPDLKTAYITLSGYGTLVAVDWPRHGLPLHHLNR